MAVKIGSEFQINSFTDNAPSPSSVTSLTDGGFVTIWSSPMNSRSDIYGQRYDANGTKVGQTFRVNTNTEKYQSVGSVATLTNGGFVVTWTSLWTPIGQTETETAIYGQRYNANGNQVSSEFRIDPFADEPINSSAASLSDGGFVVIWETWGQTGLDYNIYGQRYDLNGEPLGTEFRINNLTTNISRFNSSVVSLTDGGFVITWLSSPQQGLQSLESSIYGRRYDADGNPVGSEFLIHTSISGSRRYLTLTSHAVASLSDGEFVVIWDDDVGDSGEAIYGQRYDANSNRVGQKFRINTFNDAEEKLSSVTSLTNGGFVVTWMTYPREFILRYSNIYGQEYDANGFRVGSEFLVDENDNGIQGASSVASLPNNKFVVTWASQPNNQYGADVDIYGQIFRQGSFVGVFEIDKLARSGFINQFSFTPIEVNGLPLGSLYDETYYLTQNPDVAAAVNSGVFSNGYTHFVNFGGVEGRNPSTLYNEDFYLSHNPDVADAVAIGTIESGSVHYALFGHQEGRSPSELFNEQAYRMANPDVNDAITNGNFRSGFEHYLKSGKDEGRLPDNFLYDESYYLRQNPDVAAAVAADIFEDGFAHYLQFGQTEQRNPSSLFNESQYLTLNPDVADAVNSNLLTSGFGHYILSGQAEGRQL